MRFNLLLIFLLLFSLCFFTSCTQDPGNSWGEPNSLVAVEGSITFKVHESHKEYDCNCEPSIVLSMATEKIYGCCNFSIKSEISCSGNNIDVKILGVYIPNVCLTALGPAGSRDFLSLTEGRYYLNFIYKFMMDRYELTVSDSSIEVNKIFSLFPNFTKPEFLVFWRYPRNSFVYLCGTMTETSWICSDFLDILLREVDLEEFNFPDYGEICYPRSSEGHYYDMPAKYFIYKNEEDFDKAGEILESYSKSVLSNYPGVGLSLTNWKNRFFYSWLFNNN